MDSIERTNDKANSAQVLRLKEQLEKTRNALEIQKKKTRSLEDEKKKRFYFGFTTYKSAVGIFSILIGIVAYYGVVEDQKGLLDTLWVVLGFLCIAYGISTFIPFGYIFNYIIVNPQDDEPNLRKQDLTLKLRLRALLFNNLSVIVLAFNVFVIVIGFYFLVFPVKPEKENKYLAVVDPLSITALIVFLVHVLFRVFKYLVRVAAFYSGKADAIEFNSFEPTISLIALSELFTPSAYDITDLPDSPITDSIEDNILKNAQKGSVDKASAGKTGTTPANLSNAAKIPPVLLDLKVGKTR